MFIVADYLTVEIGRRVRRRREELGFTREQLAEICDLSTNFFAGIELGKKNMSAKSLYMVAKALNLSADFILFGEGAEAEKTNLEKMLGELSKEDRDIAKDILKNFVIAVKNKR
jgi:transcriptional regulator with XRE-family HTH domain